MDDCVGTKLDKSYTVEVIATEAGVSGLEEAWNRLSANSKGSNPFMTFGWYRAWLRRLMADEGCRHLQPYVLVIKQNQEIVGITPLVRRVAARLGFRMRKLEFLTHHSDYNEFVVGEDVCALTQAAMDFLARTAHEWDFADFREMRDHGARIAALKSASERAALPFRVSAEPGGCLHMPIDAPWSETRRRKHLRFARRASLNFEERAGEGFRAHVVDRPHQEVGLLERIIAVEAQKRVGGKQSHPFVGAYPEVFQSLFDDLGPRGLIAVVLIERGDRLVAWRLLFRHGTKLWDYQTAYDPAFADVSPGTILVCTAIDYGYAHGCDEFDFLRGTDDYKWRWTSIFRRNQRMILWNRRLIPRLGAFAYFKLRLGRRR